MYCCKSRLLLGGCVWVRYKWEDGILAHVGQYGSHIESRYVVLYIPVLVLIGMACLCLVELVSDNSSHANDVYKSTNTEKKSIKLTVMIVGRYTQHVIL